MPRNPPKMGMHIGSQQGINPMLHALAMQNQAPKRNQPSSLNAPIIARINNMQPGCGGCGR